MLTSSSECLTMKELRLIVEALDSSESPFTLYSNDNQLIYANRATRSLWPELFEGLDQGLSLEEATKKEVASLLSHKTEPEIENAANIALVAFRQKSPVSILGTQGRWIETTHHVIEGKAIASMGVDVSHLKAQEAASRKARTVQTQTIEALGHGIMIADKAGIIRQVNADYKAYSNLRGIEVFIGMELKDHIGQTLELEEKDYGGLQFTDWYDQVFKDTICDDTIVNHEEYRLPDGRHILRRQHYNNDVGYITTLTDISELKHTQGKLDSTQAQKVQEPDFLADINQNMRRPVSAIIAIARLLEKSRSNSEEQKLVKLTESFSGALLGALNDVLDLSEYEGAATKASKSPDLNHDLDDGPDLSAISFLRM